MDSHLEKVVAQLMPMHHIKEIMLIVELMLHGVGKQVVQQYQTVTEVSLHQFLQIKRQGFL